MTRDQLQQFARVGAQARLEAISEERESILRAFPDLGKTSAPRVFSADGAAPRPRKRSQMSAAERRAVGKRMKAYWAKRRAEKAGGKKATAKPKRQGGMSAEARQRQAERMKAYWAAKRAHTQTNAGSAAAAEAADTGAASSPSRKASRKAAREGGRKAGQKQGRKR